MKRLLAFIFGDKKDYVFYSEFRVDKCIDRLKRSDRNARSWFEYWSRWDPLAVLRHQGGKKFSIFKKYAYFRNSFEIIFFGTIERDNIRTKISGHFGVPTFVKVVFTILLSVSIFLQIFILIIDPIFFFIPLSFIVVCLMLVLGGMWIVEPEKKDILEFIQTTLEASPPLYVSVNPKIPDKSDTDPLL